MAQLKLTDDILSAALAGYEAQRDRIDTQIAKIRGLLKDGRGRPEVVSEIGKPSKKRSAAVRRRRKRAQRLRWSKIKDGGSKPPQPAANITTIKPKRKLSPAARRSIAEAQKKRW